MTNTYVPIIGNSSRSLLITGGTGFLGRALVKRLLADHPLVRRICIYSRGEVTQHLMRHELEQLEGGDRLRWLIGDVRDRERLRRAMEGVDYVIHAAALKRVEVGEYNPTEMVRTNVGGAENVIEAAIDAGVRKVVAVSTDKACEPAQLLRHHEAVAEKPVPRGEPPCRRGGPRFSVVRYGNVANSTGSVIPTWRARDRARRADRITDPDCTRFWMVGRRGRGPRAQRARGRAWRRARRP
jgi:UDP-N-acetylglucosamine 4,6-dehydratase